MSAESPTIVAHSAGTTEAELQSMATTSCDMLEVDIHQTKDGELVLASGPEYQFRNHSTPWPEVTLGDTADIDVASVNEHAPLSQAIRIASDAELGLMIDVKQGPHYYDDLTDELIEILQTVPLPPEVVVISFDHAWIQSFTNAIQSCNLNVLTGVIYVAHLHKPEEVIQETGVDIVETQNRFVTDRLQEAIAATDTVLSGWATASPDRLREQICLGVEYYKTDDVQLAAEIEQKLDND